MVDEGRGKVKGVLTIGQDGEQPAHGFVQGAANPAPLDVADGPHAHPGRARQRHRHPLGGLGAQPAPPRQVLRVQGEVAAEPPVAVAEAVALALVERGQPEVRLRIGQVFGERVLHLEGGRLA